MGIKVDKIDEDNLNYHLLLLSQFEAFMILNLVLLSLYYKKVKSPNQRINPTANSHSAFLRFSGYSFRFGKLV